MYKFLQKLFLLFFLIIITQQISAESKHKLRTFDLNINVDYNEVQLTIDQLKIMKNDYQELKQKIISNETQEYSQCLDFVVALQCQKMDIWQATIKELQIENNNSKEVQIPFLQQRKTNKIEKLKQLLELTNESDNQKEQITTELETNRKKILGAVDLLQEVYSVIPKTEFIQKFNNQMKDLSASQIKHHIQNTANFLQNKQGQENELNEEVDTELSNAHLKYLEKDQQIQAQTTVNVIKSSEIKINDALTYLSQSYDSKLKELKLQKQQLKQDIESLRTQLQQFEDKIKHNEEKIQQFSENVKNCLNKPQNKENDCDPIKEKSKRDLIEVEIILNKINLIQEQLGMLINGKESIQENSPQEEEKRKQLLQKQIEADQKVKELISNSNNNNELHEAKFNLQGSYRDVGAEAIGNNNNSNQQQQFFDKIQSGIKLEDRNQEYKYRNGSIEYDGHYLKDLKGYKSYD